MSDAILALAMARADARLTDTRVPLRAAGVSAGTAAAMIRTARAALARGGLPLRPEAVLAPDAGSPAPRLRLLSEGEQHLVVVEIAPPSAAAPAPIAWTVETADGVVAGSAADGALPDAVARAIADCRALPPRLEAPVEGGRSGPTLRLLAAAAAAQPDPDFVALAVVPDGTAGGALRWIGRATRFVPIDPPGTLPVEATRLLLDAAVAAGAILRAGRDCGEPTTGAVGLLSDGHALLLAEGWRGDGAPAAPGAVWRPLTGVLRSAHERLAASAAVARLCTTLIHGI